VFGAYSGDAAPALCAMHGGRSAGRRVTRRRRPAERVTARESCARLLSRVRVRAAARLGAERDAHLLRHAPRNADRGHPPRLRHGDRAALRGREALQGATPGCLRAPVSTAGSSGW